MNRNRLGRSGIVVSDICMGTMTFGTGADEKTAFKILDKAFDAGIDFFDTAEMYPVPPDPGYVGRTEEIVGRWLKTKPRDAIILATKVAGPSHGWIRAAVREGMTALDRHNIVRAFEGSLKKLQTDYIDLYQTHWPDHDMPYEETLAALDELIQAGKVRIIGCSNETTWGLTKSLGVSELHGLARYETIQNNYSLNNRRFEDELAQACRQEQVSLIPYSPLAGGVLTRPRAARDFIGGVNLAAHGCLPYALDRHCSTIGDLMIILAGTITCDPEKMEEALTAIRPLMEATQAEEGCINYALSADSLVPGLIRIYEEWETDEALQAHMKAPHMAEFQGQTSSFGVSGMSLNHLSGATITKLA